MRKKHSALQKIINNDNAVLANIRFLGIKHCEGHSIHAQKLGEVKAPLPPPRLLNMVLKHKVSTSWSKKKWFTKALPCVEV